MGSKYVVSLRDIADRTGVSISTVSRVIRGKGETSKSTRERVLTTATEMGYQDNLLVQGIRTGQTRTVGVCVRPQGGFHSEIVDGIHHELVAADYAPLLLWAEHDNGATELQQLHRCLERRVEGVIIRPHRHDADLWYFHDLLERGLPLVLVDTDLPGVDLPFVGTDDRGGAGLAVDYLAELGHRVIGHIACALEVTSTGRDRRQGFLDGCKRNAAVQPVIVEQESFGREPEIARRLLAHEPRPTAVFTANDYVAVAIYDAARELGLRIPQDVSLIGFADLEFADFLWPRLTTVRQRPYQIGQEAVRMMFDLLRHPDGTAAPPSLRLSCELVERASTAPPASTL